MAVGYKDLVTVAEVKSAAFGDRSGDATDNFTTATEDLISDITNLIEDHLDRRLIVRSQRLRFGRGKLYYAASGVHRTQSDWIKDAGYTLPDDTNTTYVAYTDEWPVVEVTSVDGDSSLASEISIVDDGQRLAVTLGGDLDYLPTYIDAFVGYKRSDQTLAGLQGEGGLSSLSVEPQDLPGGIRRVAKRLCLAAIHKQREGLLGRNQKTHNIGGSQVTVDSIDTAVIERELRRISTQKKLV